MFADGLWVGGHLIGSFRASVHSAESPTTSSGPGGHFHLPTRGSLPRLGLSRRAIRAVRRPSVADSLLKSGP